ncbi:hypothetical protein [Nitrincola sp. MINF-07-Sa-05]|uniref:hypothetical protein n=1 Tax=Nitrincola salilacus TaxID=3400273 RepID=UPI00391846E6
MRTKLLALLVLLSTFALPAFAADYYVDVTNNTGYQIDYMHVSPADAQNWEEDVLGNNVMPNGTTQRVTLTGYNSSIFDIRLIDSDGDSYTFWDIDVSEYDLIVKPEDLD